MQPTEPRKRVQQHIRMIDRQRRSARIPDEEPDPMKRPEVALEVSRQRWIVDARGARDDVGDPLRPTPSGEKFLRGAVKLLAALALIAPGVFQRSPFLVIHIGGFGAGAQEPRLLGAAAVIGIVKIGQAVGFINKPDAVNDRAPDQQAKKLPVIDERPALPRRAHVRGELLDRLRFRANLRLLYHRTGILGIS